MVYKGLKAKGYKVVFTDCLYIFTQQQKTREIAYFRYKKNSSAKKAEGVIGILLVE